MLEQGADNDRIKVPCNKYRLKYNNITSWILYIMGLTSWLGTNKSKGDRDFCSSQFPEVRCRECKQGLCPRSVCSARWHTNSFYQFIPLILICIHACTQCLRVIQTFIEMQAYGSVCVCVCVLVLVWVCVCVCACVYMCVRGVCLCVWLSKCSAWLGCKCYNWLSFTSSFFSKYKLATRTLLCPGLVFFCKLSDRFWVHWATLRHSWGGRLVC